jgi:FkbM family methyltransferase
VADDTAAEMYLSGKDVTGVIHVGAHIGQEVPFYAKKDVPVLLFEPLEGPFKELLDTIKPYPQMIAENIALGDKTSTVTIFESSKNGVSSSILKPTNHLIEYPERSFTPKSILQTSLDEYFIDHEMIYNTLVIDVQGYELFVLNGGIETLKNIKYILLEVWRKVMYENSASVATVDAFMEKHGFVRKEIDLEKYHIFGDALYQKRVDISF